MSESPTTNDAAAGGNPQALYRRFPTASHSRPFDHELATMRELAREKADRKAAEAEAADSEVPPSAPTAEPAETAALGS